MYIEMLLVTNSGKVASGLIGSINDQWADEMVDYVSSPEHSLANICRSYTKAGSFLFMLDPQANMSEAPEAKHYVWCMIGDEELEAYGETEQRAVSNLADLIELELEEQAHVLA